MTYLYSLTIFKTQINLFLEKMKTEFGDPIEKNTYLINNKKVNIVFKELPYGIKNRIDIIFEFENFNEVPFKTLKKIQKELSFDKNLPIENSKKGWKRFWI